MPKIVRNEIEYSSTTSTANQISYLNTVSGLSATNVQGAIDEVDGLLDTKASSNWINQYTASSGNPATIANIGNFGSVMLIGCAQGIGGVAILIKITSNAISSIIDMYTGNPFSSSYLSITFDSTTHSVILTTSASSNSYFIAIKSGF